MLTDYKKKDTAKFDYTQVTSYATINATIKFIQKEIIINLFLACVCQKTHYGEYHNK